MEKLGEQGDLVHDGTGQATGGRCVGELPDPFGTGKFFEDVGDAGGSVGIVVGLIAPDALESWVEFAAPVFTIGEVDVGQEDESELGVVDGDAVGLHPPGL